MKMAKFPWVNKNKILWYEDNYFITVDPIKNKLRISNIDMLEFHKRWGLAGSRGPFAIFLNIKQHLLTAILDEFEQPKFKTERPKFLRRIK